MKKILIVDDMEHTILVSADTLKAEGYQVVEAIDGRAGVEMALSELPDLIIMDVNMPIMDGLEAIKLIRDNPQIKDIPILVSTGKDDIRSELTIEKGREIQGYIEKPYKITELAEKVNSFFEDK
jgi:CheY-like chemotaxis protein